MKYFFKTISFIGLMITSVIFGIVFFGEKTIPDHIHLVGSEQINLSEIYSLDVSEESGVKTANTDSTVSLTDGDGEREYKVDITLLNAIPVKSSTVSVSKRQYVVAGGEAFGIRLYTDGVIVVGMDEVLTESGTANPGKSAGLEIGDVITALDGNKIKKVSELTDYFANVNGNEIGVSAVRNGKPFEATITLVKSVSDGKNKAGLWIRDSTAGVGTITYFDKKTGVFGGLGHAVCDVDSGVLMPMLTGDAVEAVISGCYKGTNGVTGELCGVFTNKNIGSLKINCSNGIYGVLDTRYDGKEIPVATKQEVTEGPVKIISTVDENGPQYYDAEIVKILKTSDSSGKNMIIEVTDSALIEKTGGIVQGMSGSPIIQNGMLVGAVTHVFVNNSLQGYAIFAENMLNVSQEVEDSVTDKAS